MVDGTALGTDPESAVEAMRDAALATPGMAAVLVLSLVRFGLAETGALAVVVAQF